MTHNNNIKELTDQYPLVFESALHAARRDLQLASYGILGALSLGAGWSAFKSLVDDYYTKRLQSKIVDRGYIKEKYDLADIPVKSHLVEKQGASTYISKKELANSVQAGVLEGGNSYVVPQDKDIAYWIAQHPFTAGTLLTGSILPLMYLAKMSGEAIVGKVLSRTPAISTQTTPHNREHQRVTQEYEQAAKRLNKLTQKTSSAETVLNFVAAVGSGQEESSNILRPAAGPFSSSLLDGIARVILWATPAALSYGGIRYLYNARQAYEEARRGVSEERRALQSWDIARKKQDALPNIPRTELIEKNRKLDKEIDDFLKSNGGL